MKVNFSKKKQKNSQKHRWNEAGRDHWRSLGPPRAGCTEPYPNDFYLSPRRTLHKPLSLCPVILIAKKAFPDVQEETPMP